MKTRALSPLAFLASAICAVSLLPSCSYFSAGRNKCETVSGDIVPPGLYPVLGVFFDDTYYSAMDTSIPGYLAVGPGHPEERAEEVSYWIEDGDGGVVERTIEAYPNAIQNRGPVHPACPPPAREDFDKARLWLDRGNGLEEVAVYADVDTGMPFIDWLLEGNSKENPLNEYALTSSNYYFPSYALPLYDYKYQGDLPAYKGSGWFRILFPTEGGWSNIPEDSSLGEPVLVVHDSRVH